jgi:hypothetical protein
MLKNRFISQFKKKYLCQIQEQLKLTGQDFKDNGSDYSIEDFEFFDNALLKHGLPELHPPKEEYPITLNFKLAIK